MPLSLAPATYVTDKPLATGVKFWWVFREKDPRTNRNSLHSRRDCMAGNLFAPTSPLRGKVLPYVLILAVLIPFERSGKDRLEDYQ